MTPPDALQVSDQARIAARRPQMSRVERTFGATWDSVAYRQK